MRSGFMFVFWGLFLVFLDFRINGLDLLPDFAGYILIAIGFNELTNYHSNFETARIFSIVLIVLSLFTLIKFDQGPGFHFNPILSLIQTAYMIIDLLMIWFMCNGIAALATAKNNPSLVETAIFRRNLYFGLALAGMLVVVIAAISPPTGLILIIPFIIFLIVMLVLMLNLVWRASRELDTPPSVGQNASGDDYAI